MGRDSRRCKFEGQTDLESDENVGYGDVLHHKWGTRDLKIRNNIAKDIYRIVKKYRENLNMKFSRRKSVHTALDDTMSSNATGCELDSLKSLYELITAYRSF